MPSSCPDHLPKADHPSLTGCLPTDRSELKPPSGCPPLEQGRDAGAGREGKAFVAAKCRSSPLSESVISVYQPYRWSRPGFDKHFWPHGSEHRRISSTQRRSTNSIEACRKPVSAQQTVSGLTSLRSGVHSTRASHCCVTLMITADYIAPTPWGQTSIVLQPGSALVSWSRRSRLRAKHARNCRAPCDDNTQNHFGIAATSWTNAKCTIRWTPFSTAAPSPRGKDSDSATSSSHRRRSSTRTAPSCTTNLVYTVPKQYIFGFQQLLCGKFGRTAVHSTKKDFQARACNTLAFRAAARSATHQHRAHQPAP